MIKRKRSHSNGIKENKIEFDLEELAPLLIANKTEGFRQIGEKRSSMLYWKRNSETYKADSSAMETQSTTSTSAVCKSMLQPFHVILQS